jgi:predicted XRE-type DNA-binding protein
MTPPDIATIQALRSDVALQVARHVTRTAQTQSAAARQLGIPQPTLSRIMRGRVTDLSLELLIRIAVRAGLPVVLQTGTAPEEAGAYVSQVGAVEAQRPRSRLAEEARDALTVTARRLTPEQRLEAHLRHSELVTSLHRAAPGLRTPGKRAR